MSCPAPSRYPRKLSRPYTVSSNAATPIPKPPCSVAVFRLDKENTDEDISDEFLSLLQKTFRQKDIVAKRKPHSFMAIMPDTDEAGCRKACENVLEEWKHLYGTECPVLSDVKTI